LQPWSHPSRWTGVSSNESDSQITRIENSCAGFGKLIRDESGVP
jgi:hypothetical protein